MLHHTTRPRRMVWRVACLAALSLLPMQLVARAPQRASSDAARTAPIASILTLAARRLRRRRLRQCVSERPSRRASML